LGLAFGPGFTFQSFLFVPHKKGFPLQSLIQKEERKKKKEKRKKKKEERKKKKEKSFLIISLSISIYS